MITTYQAETIVYEELAEVMKDLGILRPIGDTSSLDNTKIYYFTNYGFDYEATKNLTYLILDVSNLNTTVYDDNSPQVREAYVLITIYSRKAKQSKEIQTLINNLEQAMLAKGYSFELSLQPYFNQATNTWSFSYESRKSLWLN